MSARAASDQAVVRRLILQARADYPEWARITPAKRRLLQHLVDNGDIMFWPAAVLRSTHPMRRLIAVGYVEEVYDAQRFVVSRITDDGRAALAAKSQRKKRSKGC